MDSITPTPDRHERLALGIQEAAEAVGLGRSTLFKLLAAGELKAVKIGRRRLILKAELDRFIQAREVVK